MASPSGRPALSFCTKRRFRAPSARWSQQITARPAAAVSFTPTLRFAFQQGSRKRPENSIFCTKTTEQESGVTQIPDVVIEILTEDYQAKDREAGLPFYLSQNIRDIVPFNPYTGEIAHYAEGGVHLLQSPSAISQIRLYLHYLSWRKRAGFPCSRSLLPGSICPARPKKRTLNRELEHTALSLARMAAQVSAWIKANDSVCRRRTLWAQQDAWNWNQPIEIRKQESFALLLSASTRCLLPTKFYAAQHRRSCNP